MTASDDRTFLDLLEPAAREAVERDEAVAFGLWPNFNLAYFNDAWIRFAKDNGAPARICEPDYLGTPILDVVAEPLKPFYRDLYRNCLRRAHDSRVPPRVVQHEYECSSAQQLRRFMMTIYPLRGARGLLVLNALVAEGEHDPGERGPQPAEASAYADANGLIHQCAHCRRVQHQRIPNRWDWIPAWVEHMPPQTSHGLCPVCCEHYYPEREAGGP